MKRRNVIKSLFVGIAAAVSGVNVFGSDQKSIPGNPLYLPHPSTDMSKPYSGLMKFTDKDMSDPVFVAQAAKATCNRALVAVGNGANITFTYIPAYLPDKNDPLGMRAYLCWRYEPDKQRGKQNRESLTIHPCGKIRDSDMDNYTMVLDLLHGQWDSMKVAA